MNPSKFTEIYRGDSFCGTIFNFETGHFETNQEINPCVVVSSYEHGGRIYPALSFGVNAIFPEPLPWDAPLPSRHFSCWAPVLVPMHNYSLTQFWNYLNLLYFFEMISTTLLPICQEAYAEKPQWKAEWGSKVNFPALRKKAREIQSESPSTRFVDNMARACLTHGIAVDSKEVFDCIANRNTKLTPSIKELLFRDSVTIEM